MGGMAGDATFGFIGHVFRPRAHRSFARCVGEERIADIYHVTHSHVHRLAWVVVRRDIEQGRAQAPARMIGLDAQEIAPRREDAADKFESHQFITLVVVTNFRRVDAVLVFDQVLALRPIFPAK